MGEPLIGIFGAGFLGTSCYKAFSQIKGWNIIVWDKYPDNSLLKKQVPDANFDYYDAKKIYQADIHFVCVPTPMIKETGECYTGIVKEVIDKISKHNKNGSDIIIKSTVPPGTTKKFNKKVGRVFFNPEFLVERTAYQDFINLPYQIIGNPGRSKSDLLIRLYKDAYEQGIMKGGQEILECDSSVAEMVKLVRNCYLATRLSYFNEIKQICDKLNISYDEMKQLAGLDERVGNHYNMVPGPDGKCGFSLSCLPKDLNDLMYLARSLDVDPKVMSGVWQKNLEIRPEKDWEEQGRSIIEKLNK